MTIFTVGLLSEVAAIFRNWGIPPFMAFGLSIIATVIFIRALIRTYFAAESAARWIFENI